MCTSLWTKASEAELINVNANSNVWPASHQDSPLSFTLVSLTVNTQEGES